MDKKLISEGVEETVRLLYMVYGELGRQALENQEFFEPKVLLENARAIAISLSIEQNRNNCFDMGEITDPGLKRIDNNKSPEKAPRTPVDEHGAINVYAIVRRLWERGELPKGAFVDLSRYIKQAMNYPPSFKLSLKDIDRAIEEDKLPEVEVYHILKNNGVVQ